MKFIDIIRPKRKRRKALDELTACPDCGYKQTNEAWSWALVCPKCGLYAEGIAPEVDPGDDFMSWYPG